MDEAAHTAASARLPDPVVRTIAWADIVASLALGLRDFAAAPQYGLFFGGVYAFGGIAIVACLFWLDLVYLAYPLAAGFAMIGPFIAAGLYTVSLRRERGQPLSFRIVLGAAYAQRSREMAWMAFVSIFMLIMWLYQVRLLIALFLGLRSFGSLREFLQVLVTTPEGLTFLVIGHVAGAILSLIAFTITVVSVPLLVEREHDFITAIITSFRAVAANPLAMLSWAVIVVIAMVAAMMPLFAGLLVVLPVLGHATWHIYRRVVAPVGDTPPVTTATA